MQHSPAALCELFAEQASRTPHHAAVVDENAGTFLSYAEVDRLSDDIADTLRFNRSRVGEWVSYASECAIGKLLGLLGTLKAGAGVPSRYTAIASRIRELVTGGHAKTLLLNRGVALESSECTPACPVSRQARAGEAQLPRFPAAPGPVRHLHVVDPVGSSQHIEVVDWSAAGPVNRAEPAEGVGARTLVESRLLANSVLKAAVVSQEPKARMSSPPALAQGARRAHAAAPGSDRGTGPLDGDRSPVTTVRPPGSPVSVRACGLTRAETSVARLVAEGLTNKEIADLLVLSVHTVGTHVRSSFSKLDVTNRVALARKIIFHDCAGQSASGLA
ncbi:LuxR C-terminal-related transcriptional regulator [Streptomyces iconiensis]|uniref:LuxR C-terminal-related transcriptional regulator n=1 Tax=Streptomyces iconiensis TaxID=1384038 RepID=A0ABT6ZND0_9ACTN|nr:LuxR C-terminal-related transcriptional regulator [Streptomyces iconiensis]MDJ1130561.1 LuxR C-terminal-related transcriptional regulator [Streptomyces iconiensis]